MKFKIRPPFAVHHEKVITREQAGATIKQPVVESHYDGEEIDLSPADARKHLHKLEPVDAEATAFMESIYDQNAIVANSRAGVPAASPTPEDIQKMIDSAVGKALAARDANAAAAASTGGAGKTK